MRSDDATVRIRYKRLNNNYLRATVIIYDPVYFAEPYIRTSLIWALDPNLVPAAVSVRGGDRERRRAWQRAALSAGQEPAAGAQSEENDEFGTPYEARLGGARRCIPNTSRSWVRSRARTRRKSGRAERPMSFRKVFRVSGIHVSAVVFGGRGARRGAPRVQTQTPRPAWAWKPAAGGCDDRAGSHPAGTRARVDASWRRAATSPSPPARTASGLSTRRRNDDRSRCSPRSNRSLRAA
jgi:hypothetical protein